MPKEVDEIENTFATSAWSSPPYSIEIESTQFQVRVRIEGQNRTECLDDAFAVIGRLTPLMETETVSRPNGQGRTE